MKPNFFRQMFLAGCWLALAACTTPTVPPTTTSAPTTLPAKYLVIGEISDDPSEVIEGAQPLADYLAAQLKDQGFTGGKVRVVASTDEMVALLQSGEIDVYCDSTYPATLVSDASGAQIILRRWRFGVESYHSIIFATQASGITSLADLPGKMVAMDAPYSTSGFLLPSVTLLENGLQLVGKQATEDAVAPTEVGFVFAYDDENILQWVLAGLAAAGVTDDYNFNVAFPREAVAKLTVLAETEATPRQVVLVRPGLAPQVQAALKLALRQADETPAGQAALESYQTSQFDEFPEGLEAATQRMREMMALVQHLPLP